MPPRKPLGIFKALMVKPIRNTPSDRELYRRLWNDESLRAICDIEPREKPYHPSQITRFRDRVGPERLGRDGKTYDLGYNVAENKGLIKILFNRSLELLPLYEAKSRISSEKPQLLDDGYHLQPEICGFN